MRIGIAGLNALYWPVSAGNFLANRPDVSFLAAATLGESPEIIKASLGQTPLEYAARYHIQLYEQAEEMIREEGLDTVMIVSAHSEHASWVEKLAALGVNLYIPKTFVTTMEQADRILRVQKETGVKIAVGPSARFLPPMAAVKRALEENLIGQPFALRICHHHGTIDVFNPDDWYREPQEGGPELSLGWYGIDLALQLMGGEVSRVTARYGNFTSPDSSFMDCGRIMMEMKQGGIASFDMYFCNRFNYPSWQLELVGPKGILSLHRGGSEPYTIAAGLDNGEGYRPLPLPENSPNWEMFWVDEFLAGREPSVDATYARLVTQISLTARFSASSGKTIQVSEMN